MTAYADAPMFRGGSGLTGSFAGSISAPLSLSWKHTVSAAPNNPSSPAVIGKDVFFVSGSRIYCVDSTSGGLKWRYPADQPMASVVHASPAVADGTVYVAAGDGKLYALNAATGILSWAYDTRSTIQSSPTIVDGIVYFGSGDGRLWAIDTRTHDTVATWKGGVKLTDEIAGAPAVANGMVYALTLDQVLHAVGTATGKERYSQRLPGTVLRQSPIVSGEYVFVANGGNINCFLGRNLTQKWFVPLPGDLATAPAISDQAVYAITTDSTVFCLDARTGRLKWKSQKRLPFEISAPPVIVGSTLVVAANEGAVYLLDADKGTTQWFYKLEPSSNSTEQILTSTNFAASPVVADGVLYLLSDDGTLSAFKANAPDTVGPLITDIEPEMGIVANGEPPYHFEAKIYDEGSGVNPDSIKISIDGEGAPKRPEGREGEDRSGYRFDIHDNMLEYDVIAPTGASAIKPLPNGRHSVTISASDWLGNVTTKTWSFTIDNSITRKLAKKKPASSNTGASGRTGLGGMGGGGKGSGRSGGGGGGGAG